MANAQVTVNRHKYIGGSDLPNIMGLNETKYDKSIFDFAKEKMGILPNTFKGNAYTKYGNLIEPIVRDHLNDTNGMNYVEASTSDELRLMRGNCDGIDYDTDSIPMLEVKSFGKELDVAYYQYQCQFYLEMYDQPAIALVGYPRPDNFYTGLDYEIENGDEFFDMSFNPDNLEMHIIERDPELWKLIYARIVKFQLACKQLMLNKEMTLDEFNTYFYGAELVTKQKALITVEQQLIGFKELVKQRDTLKASMLTEFEKYGVKSLDTGKVKITHVKSDESTKIVFDEAKFKKAEKDMFKKYETKKKVTKGKSYLLITVRELGVDLA